MCYSNFITVLPLSTRLTYLTLVYGLGTEGMSPPIDLGGRVVAGEGSLLGVWGLGRSGVGLPNSLLIINMCYIYPTHHITDATIFQ